MPNTRELQLVLRLRDEASKELQSFSTKLEGLQPSFKKIATVGAAGFAAVSALVAKTTSDFSAFDKEIQRAGANVGATADELEMFRRVAVEASRETGVAAQEAGNALFWLAGGSISAEEASAALNETIKFATANQLSLEEAARQSAAAMTLFGIEADNIGTSLDMLTKAGQVSFATMDEISAAFSEAAPVSAQLGISMEDLVSIIGSFAEVGVTGTTAGVALKRAFTEILNPSKQMVEGLDMLGLTAEDLQSQLNDPIALLGTLETALVNVHNPIDRARILSQTFGQISGPAMAALLELGTDAIREMKGELAGSSGTLEDAFRRINSARSPMELLRNEMQLLSITLGQPLMEPLKQLLGILRPIIEYVGNWVRDNPKLAATILGVAAAAFGLAAIIGTIGLVVPAVIAGFTALGTVLTFLAANPIVLIIAALALIFTWLKNQIAALYDVQVTWAEVWSQIQDAFTAVVDWIADRIVWLMDKFEQFKTLIASIPTAVKSAMSAAASAAASAVIPGFGAASAIFKAIPFANGGIVTRPTLGLVGEAGPEAIIPLSKMGSMGGETHVHLHLDGREVARIVADRLMGDVSHNVRFAV